MSVENNPAYPTGNNPNAPNYMERGRPVFVIDGSTGEPVTWTGSGNGGSTEVTVQSSDPMLDIAKGNVTGHSQVNKFGENPDITSDTEEDIWDAGGDYSFPSTANITHIEQAVDQAAMRGVTIQIQGLDADWNLEVQDVIMNAANTTTPVALTTPLIRVFRMKVMGNVVGDQDIDLTDVTGTTLYARMQAGNNQTLMAIYTVPNGKTAYMTSYYCDVINVTGKTPKTTEFYLFVGDRLNNYEFQLKHEKGIPKESAGFQHFFNPYMKITERSDIKMRAEPMDEDAHVHGGFDLILVDN